MKASLWNRLRLPNLQSFHGETRRHGLPLLAAQVTLLGLLWMVTYGSFALFSAENFGQFYDAQAKSMRAGHWDVPNVAIGAEAYIRDGKLYGYYGFVPALARIPLNALVPGMEGSWSRTSVFAGSIVTLACCYWLVLISRRWIGAPTAWRARDKLAYSAFLILTGLGSTTIYLASRAFVYHEAILWGDALALVAYCLLLEYLLKASAGRLLAACCFTYLSFFSRISSGCGPIAVIVLIALNTLAWRMEVGGGPRLPGLAYPRRMAGWSRLPPHGHLAIMGTTTLAIFTTYACVNHAKFGTWLEVAPMRYYSQMFNHPERFEKTNGVWMRPGNVPTTLYAYLSPGSIYFSPGFPWVYLIEDMRVFSCSRMDGWGPHTSLTASTPAFAVLFVIGSVALFRVRRQVPVGMPAPQMNAPAAASSPAPVFIGAILGTLPILAFCNVDNRYLHDLLPCVLIAAAFGLNQILTIRKTAFFTALASMLIVAGTYQVFVNCAFAIDYQRDLAWGVPKDKSDEWVRWRESVDRLLIRLRHTAR